MSESGHPQEWGRKRGCLTATIIALVVFIALVGGTALLTYRAYQHSLVVGEEAARAQRIADAQAGDVTALRALLDNPELAKGLFKGSWNAFGFDNQALKLLSRFGAEATPAMVGALADSGSPRTEAIPAVEDHLARHDPSYEVMAAVVFPRSNEFIGLLLRRYRELALAKGRRETIKQLADLLTNSNPIETRGRYGVRVDRICDRAAEAIAELAGPGSGLSAATRKVSSLTRSERERGLQEVAKWCLAPQESWPIGQAGWLRVRVNRLAMASDGTRKVVVILADGRRETISRSDNPIEAVVGPVPLGSQVVMLENPATKNKLTRAVTVKDGAASEVEADFDEL